MKKCLITLFLVFSIAGLSQAEEKVLYSYKGVELLLPMVNLKTVYCYDLVNERSLIGAETSYARWKSLYASIGIASDTGPLIDHETVKGIPYLGGHITGVGFLKEMLEIGAFVGRDFDRGENIAGAKASVRLW